MPFRGKPQANPKLTDMVGSVTWHRQNTWAGWIAQCHGRPGMRENEGERMLSQMELDRSD